MDNRDHDGLFVDRRPDEAETAVIGSMIRDNGCISDVALLLRSGDFSTHARQLVFASIMDLYRQNKPIDAPILADYLFRKKQIQDVGYGLIKDLLDAAPTGANAIHYAKIVREYAVKKMLAVAGDRIIGLARDSNGSPEELIEQAEREVYSIAVQGTSAQTADLGTVLTAACDMIDQAVERKSKGVTPGLTTGFSDLDVITAGLHKSELVLVAARPSVGKTAMGLALARSVMDRHNTAVYFASIEQSRGELGLRLLCAEAGVHAQRMRSGDINNDEIDRITKARRAMSEWTMEVDDAPQQSMLRITANARRLRLRKKIGLVIVDYLQLITPDNRRDPRHEQVAGISRRLKALARELAIPVVALAQLSRKSEDRENEKPKLSDLRESGSLEQDADTVMLMHRLPKAPEFIELDVAKQRNGPTGAVTLTFRKEYFRFEEFVDDQGAA